MLRVLIRSAFIEKEALRQGASNEHPHHMFSLRNKKIFQGSH